ncbi:MAG: hypothetical protein VX834_09365 [Myxococcota bacterium]|nr:hypothetical protein [Myxococcota bacterium]
MQTHGRQIPAGGRGPGPDWSDRGEVLEDELMGFVRFSRDLRNALRDGTSPPDWPSIAHPGSIRSAFLDRRFRSMRRLRKLVHHLDSASISSRGALSREVEAVASALELQARLSLGDTQHYEDYLLRSALVSEAHRACSVMLRRVREFRQDYGEGAYRGSDSRQQPVDVRTMSFSRQCGYQEVVSAFEVAERRMPIYEVRTKGLSRRLSRYVGWLGKFLRVVGWLLGCEDIRDTAGPGSALCGRFPNIYVLPLDTQICSDRTLSASRWRDVGRSLSRFRRSALRLLWKRHYRALSAEAYSLLNELTQIERTEQASLASHRFMVGLLAILSLRMARGAEERQPIRGGVTGSLILLGASYMLRRMDEGAQVFHKMGMGVLENDLPRFDVSL